MKHSVAVSLLIVITGFIGFSCGSGGKQSTAEATPDSSPQASTVYVPKTGSEGTIQHIEMFESKYLRARNVDVWLPASYSEANSYPVLYMHDGQNLFNPVTSYAKTSWEVDVILSDLIARQVIEPCIVVGIWNTEDRTIEYTPARPYALLSHEAQKDLLQQDRITSAPTSDAYLQFIVTELKPYIDSLYATKSSPEHTAICGSSMGGLVSLYALAEYPETFGKAACMSTHWPLALLQDDARFTTAYIEYLSGKQASFHHTRLYFDYGTEALDAWYPPHQKHIDSIFREMPLEGHHYLSAEHQGARHNELAWQERFDAVATFLFSTAP